MYHKKQFLILNLPDSQDKSVVISDHIDPYMFKLEDYERVKLISNMSTYYNNHY